MKRYSKSLRIIRTTMPIKSTMRHHDTPIRTAHLNTTCWRRRGETWALTHFPWACDSDQQGSLEVTHTDGPARPLLGLISTQEKWKHVPHKDLKTLDVPWWCDVLRIHIFTTVAWVTAVARVRSWPQNFRVLWAWPKKKKTEAVGEVSGRNKRSGPLHLQSLDGRAKS